MKKHPISYICAFIIVSLILTSFVGVIPANTQPGANLPCRTYGGTQSERCYALVQSTGEELGYVLAGWTTSYGPLGSGRNVLIVKTDSNGTPIVPAKISIGSNDDEAYSMVRTSDGGYALTGWTRSYNGPGMGGSDIFVLKLDANLNLTWGRVYGGLGDDQAYSIIQTSDGGYAVTGWTNSFGFDPKPNVIVMKLSQYGDVQWTKAYARQVTTHLDEGYGITEIPGGYAVVGRFYCEISLRWDGFLMYLDTTGNLLGTEALWGPYDDEAYSVAWDGYHIVVAGWTKNYGPGTPDTANIFVAKFPPTPGSPIWSNVYGWEYDEKVMDDKSLIVTNDGNYAVSGWTYSKGPGAPPNPNFLIMKLNSSNGSIIWSRVHPSIPGNNSEEAYPMIQTANGGYAIAGWTNSFGLGGDDFHFLTLDQNGTRPVCVLDLAPPIDTCDWMSDSMYVWEATPATTTMPLIDATVQSVSVCTPPEVPGEWYWKPGNWTDYALSGMPDFDQKQDNWTNPPAGGLWSYCGPVAVANSLWWFDSREETGGNPPPMSSDNYYLVTNYSAPWDDHNASNVEPLVNNLSVLMNTGPTGTDVMAMQAGIDQYLNNTGYAAAYNETTVLRPEFGWIEEEVERCEDVVLLLGFWQHEYGNDTWWRVGGHYVTVAGVNSNTSQPQLGISDPYFDNAEVPGQPGVVPVPHPVHPGDATVHNDTQYVSHDIYNVTHIMPGPGGPAWSCWALLNYANGAPIVNFQGQNSGANLTPQGAYVPAFLVVTTIDYAVAVSPTTATLVGNITFPRKALPPNSTWITPVDVWLFEQGNLSHVIWSGNATTNNTGVFNITGLTPGTYDIGIKNWTCLSEVNTSVTLSAGMTTVVNFGTVVEGDCNHAGAGTDRIGFDDYIDVLVNYGKAYWKADFDRTGLVGFDDYITVLVNYGKKGDIYIGTHP